MSVNASAASLAQVKVTVVLALPQAQYVQQVTVAAGSSLSDAVLASGLLSLLAESTKAATDPLANLELGVFNHSRPADTVVREGDRIEIYRPLTVDPKEARRIRAEVKRRRRT